MKSIFGLSLACLLSLLAACAPSATPTPEPTVTPAGATLDHPFALHVGQSITLAAEGLTVRFDGVSEDSRCPAEVACVWSGRASLSVMIKQTNQPELTQTLSTRSTPVHTEQLIYLAYQLTLVEVKPLPEKSGTAILPDQYTATFKITRRPTTTDCPPRPDDGYGYLEAICHYVIDHHINIEPGKPTTYTIKRIEERTQDNRAVVWVFLNCCGMGDIAIIDPATGEVIDFRVGAY